ncbi:putative membrane protein [Rhodopirellula maiorica SM1]|uniref:Putative membrane protein n=1 Tax=Rhodopirellula maiorica SM1 TaxID=1265738 RepID=M5S2Q1_9BACT|nr:hypothetical protein [Rhodopirellula maiorica]EMI21912.1 putative membrane protein [Rhodopirellula maiorica SM1]
MSNLEFNKNDVRLLKHCLWINAKCVILIVVFVIALRWAHDGPHHWFAMPPATATTAVATTSDVTSKLTSPESRQPNPIPPTGWRRTNRGWEHTSSWPQTSGQGQSHSISELIAMQESREPKWFNTVLGRVSGIPPLMIAVLQITMIAVIFNMAKPKARV